MEEINDMYFYDDYRYTDYKPSFKEKEEWKTFLEEVARMNMGGSKGVHTLITEEDEH